MLTKEQFHKSIGQAIQALREKQGLSRAQLAKRINERPIDPEWYLRRIAALGIIANHIRKQKKLTVQQVAVRGKVPVQFVRDLEASKIPNPESYLIYCLTFGLGISYAKFEERVTRLAKTPLDENDEPIRKKKKK